MKINIKEKCDNSKKKEFYYGAKLNTQIKDAYLGMGYLEPNEEDRKIGPGRRHEEILCVLNGKLKVHGKNEDFILNEGEVHFLSDGNKIKLENISKNRSYFIIAGGHTKHHKH